LGVNTACKKDQSEKKSIKTDTVVSQRIYNQFDSDVWETDNPLSSRRAAP